MSEKQIHLNVFMSLVGHHEAAWRHPLTDPTRIRDLSYFQEIARIAERGKLDSLFFADSPALGDHAGDNVTGSFEPTPSPWCPRGLHGAHRPHRDGLDDVQRALQPGPALRLAGPHQSTGGPAGTS
jgi:hypothetical protein